MNRDVSLSTKADPVLDLNYGRWLPSSPNAPILDLGCGDGRMLRFLSAKGFLKVCGVDRDAEALSRVGSLSGVTLECTEVGVQYLRRQHGRFKLIIVKQMIYYLDRGEVLAFMHALKDALAEDGILVIEFFNAVLLSSRFTELKDPFIRTAYTEHSMRRLIVAAGLHQLHIEGERRETGRKLGSWLYAAIRHFWVTILRAIYILERGYDGELPIIYTKSIIAVASNRRTLVGPGGQNHGHAE